MLNKSKLVGVLLSLGLAMAATSASASSLYKPAGDTGSDCDSSDYWGEDWSHNFAEFFVPALADGESVTVYGNTYDSNGRPGGSASGYFSCSGGTLTYNGGSSYYDYDYNWI